MVVQGNYRRKILRRDLHTSMGARDKAKEKVKPLWGSRAVQLSQIHGELWSVNGIIEFVPSIFCQGHGLCLGVACGFPGMWLPRHLWVMWFPPNSQKPAVVPEKVQVETLADSTVEFGGSCAPSRKGVWGAGAAPAYPLILYFGIRKKTSAVVPHHRPRYETPFCHLLESLTSQCL